jgi:hypothetical protein
LTRAKNEAARHGMAHIGNSNTWKDEAGESRVQDQPKLNGETLSQQIKHTNRKTEQKNNKVIVFTSWLILESIIK